MALTCACSESIRVLRQCGACRVRIPRLRWRSSRSKFYLQCPQIFFLLGRDSVAFDGLLYGLVVRPKSKTALLDVGNRLVPLLGKGGSEEPGYLSLYCLANWLTKLNLYVFMAFWMKAALVAHYAWQLTLSSATIGYEICQHSACFLTTFVGIHEFCPHLRVRQVLGKALDEWLMHVIGHLR